jgi:hypothetical protein
LLTITVAAPAGACTAWTGAAVAAGAAVATGAAVAAGAAVGGATVGGTAVATGAVVAAGTADGWITGPALLGAAQPATARAKMIRPKTATRIFRLLVENRLVIRLSFLRSILDWQSSYLYL